MKRKNIVEDHTKEKIVNDVEIIENKMKNRN